MIFFAGVVRRVPFLFFPTDFPFVVDGRLGEVLRVGAFVVDFRLGEVLRVGAFVVDFRFDEFVVSSGVEVPYLTYTQGYAYKHIM